MAWPWFGRKWAATTSFQVRSSVLELSVAPEVEGGGSEDVFGDGVALEASELSVESPFVESSGGAVFGLGLRLAVWGVSPAAVFRAAEAPPPSPVKMLFRCGALSEGFFRFTIKGVACGCIFQ